MQKGCRGFCRQERFILPWKGNIEHNNSQERAVDVVLVCVALCTVLPKLFCIPVWIFITEVIMFSEISTFLFPWKNG